MTYNNNFSSNQPTTTNPLNPIYNISQLLKLTQFFSHPQNYTQLHTKQLTFNYLITLNNQIQFKHHQQINSFLTSSIQNNNFSPPPLTLPLYNPSTNSYQPLTPQQPITPQQTPTPTIQQPTTPQPTTPPQQPTTSQPSSPPQQIPTSTTYPTS